jgi:hypothetical protein
MVAKVVVSGTVFADGVGGPEDRTMDEQPNIRITDPAFAKRLANLLVETRRRRDLSVGDITRASDGRLVRSQVKALEDGTAPLSEDLVEAVAGIYGADLGAILPERLPVVIDAGIIATGGVTRGFDPAEPDSLLTEYLILVRELRRQQKAPVVDLRRVDVDALAGYLGQPGERVLDRLLVLMGATRARRLSAAVLFASGVAVIGLVGGAAAIGLGGGDGSGGGEDGSVPGAGSTSIVVTTVEDVTTTTLAGPTTTTVAVVAPVTTSVTVSTVPSTTAAPTTTAAPATTVRPSPPPTVAAPVPVTTVVAVGPPPTLAPVPTTESTTVPTVDPGEPLPTIAPTTTIVDVGEPPLPPLPGETLPVIDPTPVESATGLPPVPSTSDGP